MFAIYMRRTPNIIYMVFDRFARPNGHALVVRLSSFPFAVHFVVVVVADAAAAENNRMASPLFDDDFTLIECTLFVVGVYNTEYAKFRLKYTLHGCILAQHFVAIK